MIAPQSFWQPWNGPTGTTGISFLGPTGALTGPSFYGVTGATAPTGPVSNNDHVKSVYNQIRIRVPGVSNEMVRAVLYEILNEFFLDSSCWQEYIHGIIYPSVVFYELAPIEFPNGKIISLAGLMLDTIRVPVPAMMPVAPIMALQEPPSNPGATTALVIKTVKQNWNEFGELPDIPSWVVTEYGNWIMDGVIGKLQMQPNVTYSNLKVGTMNYSRFRSAVNSARVATLRRNTFGLNAWVYPQQFRSRSQRGGISVGSNYREF